MAMAKKSLTYILYNYLYSRKDNIFTILQIEKELSARNISASFDDILEAIDNLDQQGNILYTGTGHLIFRSHCLWQF